MTDGAPDVRRGWLARDRVERLELLEGGRALRYADVVERWREDAGFARAFGDALAAAPFEAFFWETPPVDAGRVERPFECVLVDAPSLARATAEPRAFRAHFERAERGREVVAFENLGGDARLVAPLPVAESHAYPHLAAFLRRGPAPQRAALWREVARRLERELRDRPDRPLWVSTSGLGVYWLHVRLDERPKYYQHAPYRAPDA